MIKVSVIIPVYNAEKYLTTCLDSVCHQTLSDIEIICINDCSTDNSLNILKEYAQKDNRIKLIEFKENKGAAAARNIGIERAEGAYIGFVDSDDWIDLDFYEKLYGKAIEANADVVKGKLYLYDLDKKEKCLDTSLDINDKIKKNKAYFYFTFTSAIYKRNLLIENDIRFLEKLIHFEDPYFTIKVNLFNIKLIVFNTAAYYYTNNTNSTSRKNITIKHVQSIREGADKILKLINSANITEEHYKIVFNFVINQILFWANKMDCNKTINMCAASALYDCLMQCKYKENCLQFYFMEKRENEQKQFISSLRKKIEYKENMK